MTHNLKCDPKPFAALLTGAKTFEIRVNDRGYDLGDVLVLNETAADRARYTGRTVRKRVTYMVRGAYGLPENLCVMGLTDA